MMKRFILQLIRHLALSSRESVRRWIWRFACGAGWTLLVLLALAAIGWMLLPLVPLPAALMRPAPSAVELVDREGRPLRTVADAQGQFSLRVGEQAVPQVLAAATVAAEDARFWTHPGVDWRAMLRAAGQWARHRRIVSGASTITQQLIKLAEPRPRTLRTKLIEAVQALRLEQIWDKQRILTEYLNRLDYGNRSGGCAAAARDYFGRSPASLSPAEAALLAGLPQAPSRLNPRRELAGARRRQRWVLDRMLHLGWLSRPDHARAVQEPLYLLSAGRPFEAPHFAEFVLGELPAGTGGRVTTTLDLPMQREATRLLREQLRELVNHRVLDGAVVVIENASGAVRVMVGSPDWRDRDAGQVNGALAVRSAGSTLKPFTYLTAFERGWNPASVLADVPGEFATPTGIFRPQNYDQRCVGPVRLRDALANSLNIPAVRVLESMGGPAVLLPRLQASGFSTLDQPAAWYGLGLTLGNAGVRLLDLATGYACLARLGEARPWSILEPGAAGSTGVSARVFSREHCWLIADILQDDAARAPAFGFESPLRFAFPVACKTGTSSDYRDNWAVGYTPEFTVAVWTGNFDGSAMAGVSGVTGAAPVMHAMMAWLHEHRGTSWYARPAGVVSALVHPGTGHRVAPGGTGVSEWFRADQLPPQAAEGDLDALGRVRLGGDYVDWLSRGGAALAERFVLAEGVAAVQSMRILTPLPGTRFRLDPDLPSGTSMIPLQATVDCEWTSPTLDCEAIAGRTFVRLKEGRHRVLARHPASGHAIETWIEVRGL